MATDYLTIGEVVKLSCFEPIEVKLLHPGLRKDNFFLKGSEFSAGFDLVAAIDQNWILYPNEARWIPSGVSIWIKDKNYVGLVFPRSGKGGNKGLVLGNLTGVIDSDYQGEIKISAWNRNDSEIITITPGEAIAQILFLRVEHPEFKIVTEFSGTSVRAENGFGHSDGKK